MINRIIFACIASVCFGGELFENIPEIKFDSKRAILGKELYFDAGLGGGNSCDSCHNLYFNTSGTSAKIINGINPPTILNSATKKFFYKNGEILSLKEQVARSLRAKNELAKSEKEILDYLAKSSSYKDKFKSTFGSKTIKFDDVVSAISEFEKTLATSQSKFDEFLLGKYKFNPQEERGYKLFLGYNCAVCHNGVNLGDNTFGLSNGITSKVPSLRNIMQTAPYFYSGKIENLRDVLRIKIGLEFNVSQSELSDLIAFLSTLSGKVEIIEK